MRIDPTILAEAKKVASRRGVSLSALVEQYLRALLREEEAEQQLEDAEQV